MSALVDFLVVFDFWCLASCLFPERFFRDIGRIHWKLFRALLYGFSSFSSPRTYSTVSSGCSWEPWSECSPAWVRLLRSPCFYQPSFMLLRSASIIMLSGICYGAHVRRFYHLHFVEHPGRSRIRRDLSSMVTRWPRRESGSSPGHRCIWLLYCRNLWSHWPDVFCAHPWQILPSGLGLRNISPLQ